MGTTVHSFLLALSLLVADSSSSTAFNLEKATGAENEVFARKPSQLDVIPHFEMKYDFLDVCELEENKDYCKKMNGTCQSNEKKENGFECICDTFYEKNEHGACVDVCELEKNKDSCKKINGTCQRNGNKEDGFECICDTFYEKNEHGACVDVCELEKNKDFCKRINGTCQRNEEKEDGFECICDTFYEKNEHGACVGGCELRRNREKCQGLNKTCVGDQSGERYKCICRKGDVEREDGSCVGVCELEKNIEECKGLNRLCEKDKSDKGYKCVSRKGEIQAEDGSFTGLCYPNPCKHGKCVTVEIHVFSCYCEEGYTGMLCNISSKISGKETITDPTALHSAIILGVCSTVVLMLLFTIVLKNKYCSIARQEP